MELVERIYVERLAVTRFMDCLSRTERRLRVRGCETEHYQVRQVPASRIDVVVTGLGHASDGEGAVVEHAWKSGKFDGAQRDRIRIHWVTRSPHPECVPPGRLSVARADDEVVIHVAGHEIRHRALRDSLEGYDLRRLFFWHVHRYYGFLLRDFPQETEAECDLFEAEMGALRAEREALGYRDGAGIHGGMLTASAVTLAEANRLASRRLYRLARDQGWRKLTLEEKERLGLQDRPQWVPEPVYREAQERRAGFAPTGCGEMFEGLATGKVPEAVHVVRERLAAESADAYSRW